MTFTPDFCAANIRIDTEGDILYDSAQQNISYALRFPTVNIPLRDMSGLYEIADKIRMDYGYLPMMPQSDDADDESYDCDGWYNFYVGVSRLPEGDKLDNCISFTVDSNCAEDDGKEYAFELDPEEQAAVFARLDEQTREHEEKSLSELLDESEKELQELIEYEKEVGIA